MIEKIDEAVEKNGLLMNLEGTNGQLEWH